MTVSLKAIHKIIALLSVAVFSFTPFSSGQYVIKKPAYNYKENSSLTLEAIRINPNNIWMDFSYKEERTSGTININRNAMITFGGYPDKSFTIDSVKNISTNSNKATSRGNVYTFSISFPFSIDKLLLNSKYEPDKESISNFLRSFPLKMSLIECSSAYRKSNNVAVGSCFDIYDIKFNMSLDIAAVLFNQRLLQKDLVKDEFETTAAYNARTSPDSVAKVLSVRLKDWEWFCESLFMYKMKNASPTIEYNADQQVFTMQYPGVAPLRFKYPIGKARNFKDSITSRKIWIDELEGARDQKDKFYLNRIVFINSAKNKYSFGNLDAPKNDLVFTQTIERVYQELKAVFPRKDIFK